MPEKKIFRRKLTSEFVQIPNALARNPALSHKARGLLIWLLSWPEDWTVHQEMLQTHHDGRDAVRSAFNELIEAGFIHRCKRRDEQGRYDGERYFVFDSPQPNFSSEEVPQTDFPALENPTLQTHTYTKTIAPHRDESSCEVGTGAREKVPPEARMQTRSKNKKTQTAKPSVDARREDVLDVIPATDERTALSHDASTPSLDQPEANDGFWSWVGMIDEKDLRRVVKLFKDSA